MPEIPERDAAPHGRDENGVPHTPYGINVDGTPRKSNRGARPGQRQGGRKNAGPAPKKVSDVPSPTTSMRSMSDQERTGMLSELASVYLIAPLAALSAAPMVAKYIGPKHTDALAADALILDHFGTEIIGGVVLMAKSKPKMLAWMDRLEDNAATMILLSAVLKTGKAILDNHLNPNPGLAAAGRNLAQMKMAEMAIRINEEAAEVRARMAMTEPTAEYAAA